MVTKVTIATKVNMVNTAKMADEFLNITMVTEVTNEEKSNQSTHGTKATNGSQWTHGNRGKHGNEGKPAVLESNHADRQTDTPALYALRIKNV
jgi:hypothetical protein